ncbi:MAG: glycosyltransferase family 4 protein [Syntrophorhabdaceae bacterium]|nr:glycosyltransferase family 4 protein [Syntrophorhabdaceae bacterium]
MKILQLLSDWKWTGPAEPVVSLCEAQSKQGANVTIAYRKTPLDFPERTVEKEVKKRGIRYYEGFRLNRYFSIFDWTYDLKAIKAYVEDKKIDLIHTNLSHDHAIAIFSFLSRKLRKQRPLIIRTDHKREGLPQNISMKWIMSKTDGLITYSKRIMERDMSFFKLPEEKVCVAPPGIKIHNGITKDMKGTWGIKPEEKVIGVVGRLKPDRGYDVILKAFKIIRSKMGNVKLVVVGRSSQVDKSINEPIRELGIRDDVILAGYIIEDYFSTISSFDVFVMMRAGSDGTARALREVMSMGVPAVVSDLGMLPELVDDGINGFVVDSNEENLAEKLLWILKNDDLRNKLGTNAKNKAINEWDYAKQAKIILDFYDRLLSKQKNNT